MKERPILFSGPMVRAILEGRKTQTRRVANPRKGHNAGNLFLGYIPERESYWFSDPLPHANPFSSFEVPCPYGVPGDRLWVREAHAILSVQYPTVCVAMAERMPPGKTLSDTDGGLDLFRIEDHARFKWFEDRVDERWRPSIFMPREVSRLTLEVVSVGVERVQEISRADAQAEGMESCTPGDQYRVLWDHINGKREGCAWADNPWVWCISFRRAEGVI